MVETSFVYIVLLFASVSVAAKRCAPGLCLPSRGQVQRLQALNKVHVRRSTTDVDSEATFFAYRSARANVTHRPALAALIHSHLCSFPGAAASLLNLRIFEILPDDALAAAAGTLTGKKGAKSTAKDNAAANAGLVTDLSKAQTFSRPLTIRDVHTLSRQLAAFNDAVRYNMNGS